MLKRKYANRADWNRILQKNYAQSYLDTKEFKGYIALIDMVKVASPLYVNHEEENICIVDDGYMWLQQFPSNSNHAITTTFDREGNIVYTYIDICLRNGEENDIPYMDDLYLDIVILPSEKTFLLDEDELEEALQNGEIDQTQYDLAWKETNTLMNLLHNGSFKLLNLAQKHKEILEILKLERKEKDK